MYGLQATTNIHEKREYSNMQPLIDNGAQLIRTTSNRLLLVIPHGRTATTYQPLIVYHAHSGSATGYSASLVLRPLDTPAATAVAEQSDDYDPLDDYLPTMDVQVGGKTMQALRHVNKMLDAGASGIVFTPSGLIKLEPLQDWPDYGQAIARGLIVGIDTAVAGGDEVVRWPLYESEIVPLPAITPDADRSKIVKPDELAVKGGEAEDRPIPTITPDEGRSKIVKPDELAVKGGEAGKSDVKAAGADESAVTPAAPSRPADEVAQQRRELVGKMLADNLAAYSMAVTGDTDAPDSTDPDSSPHDIYGPAGLWVNRLDQAHDRDIIDAPATWPTPVAGDNKRGAVRYKSANDPNLPLAALHSLLPDQLSDLVSSYLPQPLKWIEVGDTAVLPVLAGQADRIIATLAAIGIGRTVVVVNGSGDELAWLAEVGGVSIVSP
ncbi:MAG TPA: hypothetical protein VLL52_06030 [Anaerolineae bacterium]|nr:hypothetical protein [Anaerolineae bacterium]